MAEEDAHELELPRNGGGLSHTVGQRQPPAPETSSDPPPMSSSLRRSGGNPGEFYSGIKSHASMDQKEALLGEAKGKRREGLAGSAPHSLQHLKMGSHAQGLPSESHIGEIEREMKDELRQLENLFYQETIYYRVPEITRSLDKDAYAPQFVSFGPYHRGTEALSSADKYKWFFLELILIMNKEVPLRMCLKEMDRVKQKAKGCYEEDIQMETNDQIKMLLLDGCGILGFLDILPLPWQQVEDQIQKQDKVEVEASTVRKFISRFNKMLSSTVAQMAASPLPASILPQREAGVQTHQEQDKVVAEASTVQKHLSEDNRFPKEETMSQMALPSSFERRSFAIITLWHHDSIRHDLLLMENQLPFFVLQKIYELATAGTPVKDGSLEDKVDRTIQKLLSSYPLITTKQRFQHLLHCCHLKFRPAVDNSSSSNSKPTGELQQWRGATDLYKAGIKFKPKLRDHDHDHSLLDVELVSRRILMIPTLIIEDSTSSVFRNLIAFEQSCTNENYFAAYAFFMGELMRTPADVSLLVKEGVVKNYIGADKEVSDFFNSLVKRVVFDVNGKHFLNSMFKELNSYYNGVGHKYIADLKQNYFGSPWLVISVAAAVVVLVCTVVQTVFTVIG
ncbi:UPF0481 protein At3g47200-like [Curcuma longa]|uniref:UPF0481 protein At3g47200-like n=1 Tax=Curcuma longa TaxID=136217 RepID=UPI003D9F8002